MSSLRRASSFKCMYTLSNVMFKKVILFLALASLGPAEGGRFGYRAEQWLSPQLPQHRKIVGGKDAKLGEFPYQASVVHWVSGLSYFFCGGSIISENVVLTAGHCIRTKPDKQEPQATVTAGMISLRDPGPHVQQSDVKTTVTHPKFVLGTSIPQPYDIAVLILETPFKFDKYVQPVALPEPGATFTGKTILTAVTLGKRETRNVLTARRIPGSHPSAPSCPDLDDPAYSVTKFGFRSGTDLTSLGIPEVFNRHRTRRINSDLVWVLALGWGDTSNTTEPEMPDILQKIELPLIDYEQCKKRTNESALNEFSNICTGPIGGNVASCLGDSGGPLAKNVSGTITVIGIVSWGEHPCGHGYPSVYTRVSSFIDFINNSTKSLE